MGNDNAFTRPPTAAAAGAAPQSTATQTDSLLLGGWNNLAQTLTATYALSRLTPPAPGTGVTRTSDQVVAPQATPQTVVSARPAGLAGMLGSPMGLLLLAGGALALFLALKK